MTLEKIDELLEALETQMEQLELEAAAANETEALTITAALYRQYLKLDSLTELSDRISGVLEPHCRRYLEATGQTLIEAIQVLPGVPNAATSAPR